MKVVIVEDERQGVEMIVSDLIAVVKNKATTTVGLATGGSMETIYEELVSHGRESAVNFDEVRWFLLDEYLGLNADDPARYRAVIRKQLVDPLGLDPAHLYGPEPDLASGEDAGPKYETAIRAAGGIDLQFLGIGRDGHIGFNEPGSSLASRTRVKKLRPETREDNARYFGGHLSAVPTMAITQGIGTICDARRLVLVAWGEAKAEAIAKCVEGPVTAMAPASALQLHPHVTVVIDQGAAQQLQLKDY
ncbi:MAG TPA: glucosamine-6-phosphate deaminase [Acidimicrobiales bacterium]